MPNQNNFLYQNKKNICFVETMKNNKTITLNLFFWYNIVYLIVETRKLYSTTGFEESSNLFVLLKLNSITFIIVIITLFSEFFFVFFLFQPSK